MLRRRILCAQTNTLRRSFNVQDFMRFKCSVAALSVIHMTSSCEVVYQVARDKTLVIVCSNDPSRDNQLPNWAMLTDAPGYSKYRDVTAQN